MTKEQLHSFIENSKGNESNICQIHAIKGGKTVYEDCWRGFKPEDAMHVMSVTKGVMALLTGIAIGKGYIKNTDQKVIEFFPGYTVKRGEKTIYDVTLKHLLTMTAPYKYRSEPWKRYARLMTGQRLLWTFWEAVRVLRASLNMQLSEYRSLQELLRMQPAKS